MKTQHRPDAHQAFVDEIRDRVAALVDSSTTVETSWVRVHADGCPEGDDVEPAYRWEIRCDECGGRLGDDPQRLVPRPIRTERPPLLEQLARLSAPTSGAATSAGTFESKPAARLEAIDALRTIRTEVARIAAYVLHLEGVPTSTGLRALADHAHELAPAEAKDVNALVLSWWARARVTAGWESQPMRPHVRCMVCDEIDTLRVVADPQAAWCSSCHASWDASTIGILGEHIRLAQAEPITPPAAEAERAVTAPDVLPLERARVLGLPTEEHVSDLDGWRARVASRRESQRHAVRAPG